MKELRLKLKVSNEDKSINEVAFTAPVELLLSGFKFSYVSPEKLEEEIFDICQKDGRFRANSKNNCLEESLFNCQSSVLEILDEDQSLQIQWK